MIPTLMGIAYRAVAVGGYLTATHGPAALAALAATQLLLRPVPLLAASWSKVARSDLVRRREARDWRGFSLLIAITFGDGAVITAPWTGIIFWAWRPLAGMVFHGKFASDGWMLLLWGLSALISFCQIAIGIGLQMLRAFKVLALANTLASLTAVAAILIAMGLWGAGGAILGTMIGQGLELIVMSVLLITGVRAAAHQATAGAPGASFFRPSIVKQGLMTPSLSDSDALSSLRAAFQGRLITDPAQLAPFLTDWRKIWHGTALAAVQPDTAQDVAQIVAWCAANQVTVTPQGGNTGLAGGSPPPATGRNIVLSTARLNRVREIDTLNNTVTVEAGVVLQTLQQAANDAGRLFPLSLAAEGSCTIGGNLSTNAGGVAVLRYGNARELCLGLEVVTAQGELWDGLKGLRKNNTGYDLRDLYIGSEGTLGIITAAVMKLYPTPAAKVAAFVGMETPQQAVELLQLAQARLGSNLTAFELMSARSLALSLKHNPDIRAPFATPQAWNVLMELSSMTDEAQGRADLEPLLEQAFQVGLIGDAVIAESLAQSAALWSLREKLSEAQTLEGPSIKHDISVPISRMAQFIVEGEAEILKVVPAARLMAFGHVGDGNLHFNVSYPEGGDGKAFMARQTDMNRAVHDLVDAMGGSISAEHGLGMLRRDEAIRYRPAVETRLMRAIKQTLDPLGIMNPGTVLPAA